MKGRGARVYARSRKRREKKRKYVPSRAASRQRARTGRCAPFAVRVVAKTARDRLLGYSEKSVRLRGRLERRTPLPRSSRTSELLRRNLYSEFRWYLESNRRRSDSPSPAADATWISPSGRLHRRASISPDGSLLLAPCVHPSLASISE